MYLAPSLNLQIEDQATTAMDGHPPSQDGVPPHHLKDGHPSSNIWSPTIQRMVMVIHHPKDGHTPSKRWLSTILRTVSHYLQDGSQQSHIGSPIFPGGSKIFARMVTQLVLFLVLICSFLIDIFSTILYIK